MLEVPAADADEVAGLFAGRTRGVELAPPAGGRVRLRAFLRSSEEPGPALERTAEMLRAAGLDPGAASLRVERVADGRWVERYQASLRPFDLGRGFTVFPDGRAAATASGRVALLLVPGRAFGTGEHPTTRLCVEALERHVERGSRWLDLGCGTGILSIVARARGAARVLALDDDPEAVEVAREVLHANAALDVVEPVLGSLPGPAAGAWDGVVANIHAAFFLRAAGLLASALRPGGLLVGSGFLGDDLETVVEALEQAGLHPEKRFERDGWAALVARREA